VSGKVIEYTPSNYLEESDGLLSVTMIDDPVVEVLSSGNSLPPAVAIGKAGLVPPTGTAQEAIDFWENLEGERVTIAAPVAIGGISYGVIPVLPDLGATKSPAGILTAFSSLLLRKESDNPERAFVYWNSFSTVVLSGTTFASPADITGVVTYTGDGVYTVNPADTTEIGTPTIPSYTRETTTISSSTNVLTVASYNIENFGPEWSSTATDYYSDRNSRAAALAKDIVNNLGAPDICVLVEMGDDYPTKVLNANTKNSYYVPDGHMSSAGNVEKLIAAMKSVKPSLSLSYVDISPEDGMDGGAPGMNIRVGFLYRDDRVSFAGTGNSGFVDAVAPLRDNAGGLGLSLNPGRIQNSAFKGSRKPLVGQFTFRGKKVTVVGLHLASKGGDSATFGTAQPPVLYSAEKRTLQAKAVSSFIEQCLAIDPSAPIVVAGDMNDYAWSEPVQQLGSCGLVNVTSTESYYANGGGESDRYSYNYDGNAQEIDHLFASPGMIARSPKVDIVHLNADFGYSAQNSDHDAIVASFTFD
jgi:predicted extracellular nuclease